MRESSRDLYCEADDILIDKATGQEILPRSGGEPSSEQKARFVDQGMLWAEDVVLNPSLVDKILGRYQLIADRALMGRRFDNLDRAVKIMGEKRWKPVLIVPSQQSGTGTDITSSMYVLMERIARHST